MLERPRGKYPPHPPTQKWWAPEKKKNPEPIVGHDATK